MALLRYTEDQAREAIAASLTFTEALKRLGMCWSGGNYRTLKKWAAEWSISTDRFDPDAVRRRALRRDALAAHAGRVIAVEPIAEMLELLRTLPGVDARTGTAEAIPVEDESVDVVFAGEAFHWFRTEEAAREIARVLVPGGGLALLWNRAEWDERDLPWHPEFNAASLRYREAAGSYPAEGWREALDETGLFEPRVEAEVVHVHGTDPEGFVALAGSWSWISNLPDEERRAFLARVRELIGDQRELRLRYRTEIHRTRRR